MKHLFSIIALVFIVLLSSVSYNAGAGPQWQRHHGRYHRVYHPRPHVYHHRVVRHHVYHPRPHHVYHPRPHHPAPRPHRPYGHR